MIKNKILNHKAFTLIELLLGLAIFSIVSLTLYSVFWLGVKIQNKADSINKNYQEAFLALESMTQDLENASAYDFSGSYPQEVCFKGNANQFSFLLSADKGVKRIEIYSDVPDLGKMTRIIVNQHMKSKKGNINYGDLPITFLMRRETPLTEYLSGNAKNKQEEVLAAAIKRESLKFQYGAFKSDANNQSTKTLEWKDEWTDPALLPLIVRVEMIVYNPDNPKNEITLRRDIYLSSLEADI